MTEAETEAGNKKSDRKKRKNRHRAGHGMVWSLSMAAFILTLLALALSGKAMPLPKWFGERIEASVSDRLHEGALEVGKLAVSIGRDGVPILQLSDITIGDTHGSTVAVLNAVQTRVSASALLQGKFSPDRVELDGAQVTLRRSASGQFSLVPAGNEPDDSRNLADILAQLDDVLSTDALKTIQEVEARGVVISLEDARTGRIWQATNANLILRRADDGLALSVASDVFNGTDNVAEVQLSFQFDHQTHDTTLGVNVVDMPAGDIAIQSPVLAWLGVLDAPISGAVRAEYDGQDGFESLAGTLDIAAGALNPVEGSEPLKFESARAYFDFDAGRQRIDFSEIAVQSKQLALDAIGHTYLSDVKNGRPGAFLGQFVIPKVRFDDSEQFEAPLDLSDIRADLRLKLDPFSVELAQLTVDIADEPLRVSGHVEARTDGWHVSVDAQTDRITPETVKAHWPILVSPITRKWLKNNVLEGTLTSASAGIRKVPGDEPDIDFNFDFHDGVVRFLDHMPPITAGAGRATMNKRRFSLLMREGGVQAEQGGFLDGAGSLFSVPNVREKPARGELTIAARGKILAGLSVLNNPPIRLMERAGRSIDVADGDAAIVAVVRLPLEEHIPDGEVDYFVAGDLTSVTSNNIVDGRVLASKKVSLDATPERIRLNGTATLDGVPLELAWEQPLGPDSANGSVVRGSVDLGPHTIESFDLPLPKSMISGNGAGEFVLALGPDIPPQLSLQSDLVGLGINFESLGWTKGRDTAGKLEIEASLGAVPEVNKLSVSGPGLAMEGRLDFKESGDFRAAVFSKMQVGRWLDSAVTLTPRGQGKSLAVKIEGGTFDLRSLPQGGANAGGDRAPIDINLDTAIVTDGIRLAPVTAQIDAGRAGISGSFEGRINGRTPVRGTLAPTNGGTGVRVQSADAGGAIRDIGVTPNARQGTLDVVFTPVVGAAPGTYDGQFLIEGVHLRKAPVLADLLDAISVVGLLDQLAGPGIRFGTVDGKFRLTRDSLVLKEAAAVGVSIGISASGIYDFNTKNMDISGVISPVYFVNAIGRVVSRRGEGLFGFNYRMSGPAKNPSIGVNPLSILTPGFLRNILRGQPQNQ
ncbi:MAG: DUF3971 domain-containing protein [Boseongicola sp.]